MDHNRYRNSSEKSLVKSHSIPTIFDRKIAVRVTNTTESTNTINKNTQFADFFVVTTEQSKFIKTVDTALLIMIPEGDPDLTIYLNELPRLNKPDRKNDTFWFRTPANPGNIEDYTPIQTRILKILRELQQKLKLNPKDDTQSRKGFLKQFDWTDLLRREETETEEQAVEDILVQFYTKFVRHRVDIGMNTELKVKLTP